MHYSDERTHPNRTTTPNKEALYNMLLNNAPYTAKVMARKLIQAMDEEQAAKFIQDQEIYVYIKSEEII